MDWGLYLLRLLLLLLLRWRIIDIDGDDI